MDNLVHIMSKDISNISDDNPFKQALEIGMDSIEMFENRKKEMKIDSDGYLKLLPANHYPGQIDANTLSHTVNNLQKIVYNIADLKYGKASKRGRIPDEIKEDYNLIITGTKAGSFIIEIGEKEKQLNLFRETGPIDLLTDTFNTIIDNPSPKKILSKYNLRTYNSLKNFFEDLNKDRSEFEIYNDRNQEKIYFSEKIIDNHTKMLKTRIEEEEEKERILKGILKKIDLTNNILSIEYNNSEIITINVDDNEFQNIELTTNKNYEFQVTQITYNIEGDEKENKYLLKSINDIN